VRSTALAAEIIRTEEGLYRLAPEWMDLFERIACDNAFLTFDWMDEWWARWKQSRALFVVAMRNCSGGLVALAPLSIYYSHCFGVPLSALTFLASEGVGSDHLDILVQPGFEEAAARELLAVLGRYRRDWHYIDFSNIDEDSFVATRVRTLLSVSGMREIVGGLTPCPYLPLPSSFDSYVATLSSNMRYNFRRRVRALDRQGPVEFRTVHSGPELAPAYETLIKLHLMRSAAIRRDSTFAGARIQDFHRSVLFRLASRGRAALHLLYVRGAAVAALYSLSSGGRFMFYQCGMDPAWVSYGVGMVAMGRTIETAIRAGHNEYDFLRGDEHYKSLWTKQSRAAVRLRFFDRRWQSRLARIYARLAGAAQNSKRYLAYFWRRRRIYPATPEDHRDGV
jgi:CelD/BcsL family acetyltransferase involved in cellulose biosynthesis